MNPLFMAYAMEQEGDLSTRTGKIQKVIKLLVAAGPDRCNDFNVQCGIYNEVGIDSDTFSDAEMNYIQNEVAKQI